MSGIKSIGRRLSEIMPKMMMMSMIIEVKIGRCTEKREMFIRISVPVGSYRLKLFLRLLSLTLRFS